MKKKIDNAIKVSVLSRQLKDKDAEIEKLHSIINEKDEKIGELLYNLELERSKSLEFGEYVEEFQTLQTEYHQKLGELNHLKISLIEEFEELKRETKKSLNK